jgi:hypothetical protein
VTKSADRSDPFQLRRCRSARSWRFVSAGSRRFTNCIQNAEQARTDVPIEAIVAGGHLRRHTTFMRQASRKPYLPPVFLKPDIL